MKWLIVWVVSVVGLISVGTLGLLNFWALLGGVIWLGGATFLVIYFWLAPTNRWFTFVKEGTAKVVVRGDKFEKTLIQWEERTFNYSAEGVDRWWVVPGKEPRHPSGGLRLYSILYPLDKIYTYRHRWTHLHEDGSIKSHDEWLDSVFLKEDIYAIELPLQEEGGAEDINGMPMGIKMVLPISIVNPYVATFRVRRWLPLINGVISAKLRRFVANYRYKEDLLNMRAGKGIKEIQKKAGMIEPVAEGTDLYEIFWPQIEDDFKSEGGEVREGMIYIYGASINEKGARILEINPGSRYRQYTTMQYEAEQRRKKITIEAEARAAEVMGTVIESVVTAEGRPRKKVEEEFRKEPKAFYEKHRVIIDNVMTKLSMEERAYLRIETPGATGGLGDFLRLIGAWQRMPPGRGGEREKREGLPKKRLSDEEYDQALEEAVREGLGKS